MSDPETVATSDGKAFTPGDGPAVALLTAHTRHEINDWIARFPAGRQRSATLSALRFAQEQNDGFLTPQLMDAVAEYLRLPSIQVYEVASFYSMFETHPCGRHHVSVCTNISCWLNGAEDILALPGVHLHDYGKAPRPGRKLGHCTVFAPTPAERDRTTRRVLALADPASPAALRNKDLT